MNKKTLFSLVTGITAICGFVLIVSAIVLDGRVSDIVDGTLIGIGAGLSGLGISGLRFIHWKKTEPAKWKQYEIESKDERNAAIRLRAKAAAGEVLQWVVLGAAWAAIFLNASLWIVLTAIGIFLFKVILEMCLMARYQKEM